MEQVFQEPAEAIFKQLAAALATVAFHDYPGRFPGLFVPITQVIVNGNNAVQVNHALDTLNQVLMSLSGKRLMLDARAFNEAAMPLLALCRKQWLGYAERVVACVQSANEQEAEMLLVRCKLLTKSVYCLVRYGVASIANNDEVTAYMQHILAALTSMLGAAAAVESSHPQWHEVLGEIVLCMVQTVTHVQLDQPVPFMRFMPQFANLFACLLSGSMDGNALPPLSNTLATELINFFTSVLTCVHYGGSSSIRGGNNESVHALRPPDESATEQHAHALRQILPDGFIAELVRTLIERNLKLDAQDLHLWQSEPEAFVEAHQKHMWEFRARPAAENLLQHCLYNRLDATAPVIIELLKHVVSSIPHVAKATDSDWNSSFFQTLLAKEAVLAAVGVDAFELEPALSRTQGFDFSQWYLSYVEPELTTTDPTLCVLRRRAIWLLGEWVEHIPPPLWPRIFERLAFTLANEKDVVVRLAVVNALLRFVDDMNFRRPPSLAAFSAQLETFVQHLFRLFHDASSMYARSLILSVLRLMISTCSELNCIAPVAAPLADLLWAAWGGVEHQNILRNIILQCFTELVKGLGAQCQGLHDGCVHLISLGTSPGSTDCAFLEDTLLLWGAIVSNSPALSPQLASLFQQRWGPLLLEHTQHFLCMYEILDSYVMLAGDKLLQWAAPQLAEWLTELYTRSGQPGIEAMLRPLLTVARLFPVEFPSVFGVLLGRMVSHVLELQQGQSRVQLDAHVLANYFVLFGRLHFQGHESMALFLSKYAAAAGGSVTELQVRLVEAWLAHVSDIQQHYLAKLSALGLCQLLVTNDAVFLRRCMGRILDACASVLAVSEAPDAARYIPSVDEMSVPEREKHTEAHRFVAMKTNDQLFHVSLRAFMSDKLERLRAGVGDAAFQQLVGALEPHTMRSLQQAPAMPPRGS